MAKVTNIKECIAKKEAAKKAAEHKAITDSIIAKAKKLDW